MSTAAITIEDAALKIRAMEAEFESHANAGDPAVLCDAYYASDGQLLPPNAPLAKGIAAVSEFWTAFLAGNPTGVQMETLEVHSSGDMAYSVGSYRYSQAGIEHAGKYIAVYRKEGEGYRCIADSFSDNA